MNNNPLEITDETVAADGLSEYHPGYPYRAPDPPLLGLMIGSSVSLLLWTALGVSAWALLMR